MAFMTQTDFVEKVMRHFCKLRSAELKSLQSVKQTGDWKVPGLAIFYYGREIAPAREEVDEVPLCLGV